MHPGTPRTLLYFGHAPMEGAGSAIIVLRHLKRLAAAGWRVMVVPDWGQSLAECEKRGWRTLKLTHRKWWWPPYTYRTPRLRRLRHWLWAGEVHAQLGKAKPDAAFTYLSAFTDFMSQVALAYSTRYRVPLSVIAHDDPACFAPSPEAGLEMRRSYQEIVGCAHRTWFASPQLAGIYDLADHQRSTLPPIPEGYDTTPDWRPVFGERPLIIYAGNYWPPQLTHFARLGREISEAGGQLMLLVKKSAEIESLCREEPVIWREPFRDNREALSFLSESAAGLLVAYTEKTESMPWIRTSFPSKLIEYMHLGVPVLLVAPQDSAVADWSRRNSFRGYIDSAHLGPIKSLVEALKIPQSWREMGGWVRAYAQNEFDPTRIQMAFEENLTIRGNSSNATH